MWYSLRVKQKVIQNMSHHKNHASFYGNQKNAQIIIKDIAYSKATYRLNKVKSYAKPRTMRVALALQLFSSKWGLKNHAQVYKICVAIKKEPFARINSQQNQ